MTLTASQTLRDIILETNPDGSIAVWQKKGYPEKKIVYKIDDEQVQEALTFADHEFVLLRADAADHLRDFDNKPVTDGDRWADHYFESKTHSLYRQDERGNWYDLEGFRLAVPVFLKGDVLISVPGKVSRQSLSFVGREVIISPHARLVQVGKLVYDERLAPLHYFGERVTGLGRGHVSFGGTDQWQEVWRGLTERGFVNEFTGAPLLINDEEIIAHRGSDVRGKRHFEVFASATRRYVLENHSAGDLRYEGVPLEIDLDHYLRLQNAEIVLAGDGRKQFYLDLETRAPFRIPELGEELLLHVDAEPVQLGGTDLYSMRTVHRAFVYDAAGQKAFALATGEMPTAVRAIPGFTDFWFLAEVDDRWRLCDATSRAVIRLGEDGLEIGEVSGEITDKLVNATTIAGQPVTLDVRYGARNVRLASINGQLVQRIVGKPTRIGGQALQHIELASLGGSVSRLVDLERDQLTSFGLPDDLTKYPDQPQPSAFAGNPLVRVNFDSPLEVQGEHFFRARFLTYAGEERDVLLQTINVRPVLLDGVGHRNELVVGFRNETLGKGYRLGAHVMVSVDTLTDDLKASELLYSLHRNQSWLSFYDDFLPVFRRAVPLKGEGKMSILLFESLEHIGTGEYVAVEKEEPYRLLAERKKGKVIPKIVTTKSRALLDPAEVSGLRELFLDRGMLVEVG